MTTLRTSETQQKYKDHQVTRGDATDCELCSKETLKLFTYWRIVPNLFPYDRIAQKCDMLVPIRHVLGSELSREERDELDEIKQTYVRDNYGFVLEQMPNQMTIPAHFHLHLITLKDQL